SNRKDCQSLNKLSASVPAQPGFAVTTALADCGRGTRLAALRNPACDALKHGGGIHPPAISDLHLLPVPLSLGHLAFGVGAQSPGVTDAAQSRSGLLPPVHGCDQKNRRP